MKKILHRISLLLLIGIAAYFVNTAYQSTSAYDLGQALAETLLSPWVWLIAVGALISWALSR